MATTGDSYRTPDFRRRRSFAVRILVPALRLVLLAGLVAACWELVPKRDSDKAGQIPDTAASIPSLEIRAQYPLSLIPGGLKSDVELEAARAGDPILAEHYADVGFLHPISLARDQWLYASYRQGRSIVWTTSPILVHANELVLTDRYGNLVRGRCGNRLSDTPRAPSAFVEPVETTSETPEISFVDAPSLMPGSNDLAAVAFPPIPAFEIAQGAETPRVPTTVAASSDWPAQEFLDAGPFSPVIPFYTPARAANLHPAIAPEPDSRFLLLGGAIVIAVFVWKANRRAS